MKIVPHDVWRCVTCHIFVLNVTTGCLFPNPCQRNAWCIPLLRHQGVWCPMTARKGSVPSWEALVWVWVLATRMRTPPSGGCASASATRGVEGQCSPLASPQTQPISHMCVYMVCCTTLVFDHLLIILPLAHFHRRCPRTLSFSVISLALLWYLW